MAWEKFHRAPGLKVQTEIHVQVCKRRIDSFITALGGTFASTNSNSFYNCGISRSRGWKGLPVSLIHGRARTEQSSPGLSLNVVSSVSGNAGRVTWRRHLAQLGRKRQDDLWGSTLKSRCSTRGLGSAEMVKCPGEEWEDLMDINNEGKERAKGPPSWHSFDRDWDIRRSTSRA